MTCYERLAKKQQQQIAQHTVATVFSDEMSFNM